MPDKNEQNLVKLNRLLSVLDGENQLTRDEFLKAFQEVVKQVLSIEKKILTKNSEAIEKLENTYNDFLDKTKNNANKTSQTIEQTKKIVQQQINTMIEKQNNKLREVDEKMTEVQDGKDADESRVALEASKLASNELKPLIPTIEQIEDDLPKLGDKIRDALELLQGDERIEISAIKNLRTRLQELEKKIKTSEQNLGGKIQTGFNYSAIDLHFIDDETPTGTINGTNKDFTINNTPSPTSSLKVFRGGARQRITEDYTLSGKTITFIIAPVDGEIITVDYRH